MSRAGWNCVTSVTSSWRHDCVIHPITCSQRVLPVLSIACSPITSTVSPLLYTVFSHVPYLPLLPRDNIIVRVDFSSLWGVRMPFSEFIFLVFLCVFEVFLMFVYYCLASFTKACLCGSLAQCVLSLKRLSAGPGFNPQTRQNKLFQDYWRACFEINFLDTQEGLTVSSIICDR